MPQRQTYNLKLDTVPFWPLHIPQMLPRQWFPGSCVFSTGRPESAPSPGLEPSHLVCLGFCVCRMLDHIKGQQLWANKIKHLLLDWVLRIGERDYKQINQHFWFGRSLSVLGYNMGLFPFLVFLIIIFSYVRLLPLYPSLQQVIS